MILLTSHLCNSDDGADGSGTDNGDGDIDLSTKSWVNQPVNQTTNHTFKYSTNKQIVDGDHRRYGGDGVDGGGDDYDGDGDRIVEHKNI